MGLSAAVPLAVNGTIPTQNEPASLLLPLGYYVLMEAYAGVILLKAASRLRGVTHYRVCMAAFGSLPLAVGMLVPAVLIAAGSGARDLGMFCMMGGLVISAVASRLGYATLRWLRHLMHTVELHRYLKLSAGRPIGERASESLERLCPAVTRAVGGEALVGLWSETKQRLVLRSYGRETSSLDLQAREGAIGRAWLRQEPVVATEPEDLGPEDALVLKSRGAGGLVALPIATKERAFGLLIVLFRRGALFPADDIVQLRLLTEHTATCLANAELFDQQRRLTEQLWEANIRLDQANKAKSQFLANMSHDLRTPLNAIIGFSELMLEKGMANDEERRSQSLGYIRSSAAQLISLINDILDLARTESGKMRLYPEDFYLADALQEVHDVIQPLALKKRQLLTLEVDPRLGVICHDRERLVQVMYNLLSNAVKFTPEGGLISSAAQLDETGHMAISVSDTGIGISRLDQERIFERFTRADGVYVRGQQGTGLGLALVRHLTALMGGSVHLQSQPGRGSTFTVKLPLRQPETRTAASH